MPITAQEVADALNAAGISTPQDLAAWAASLKNKGPELDKVQNRLKRLDERWSADFNARQQRVDELRTQLETARQELQDGVNPTGPIPTPMQINEVAPQTPFTPTP